MLKSLGIPFVVHGRCGEDAESYSWLDVNNKRAFMRAIEAQNSAPRHELSEYNGAIRASLRPVREVMREEG